MPDLQAGVVVIGGGSTGAGVLRDLALRGIPSLLLERGELASGTTGRSHGLLHSGARYCVHDRQAAIECAREGAVLRRIAPQAIEDTGGLFLSLTAADQEWEPRFVEGCRRSGISCEPLSVEEARRREPALSKAVRSAFWLAGDGHLDPVALVRANIESANRLGAQVRTGMEVIDFLRQGPRVAGVRVKDAVTGDEAAIGCAAVVNATGAWAGRVARLLDVPVEVEPFRGVMVVLGRRLVNAVVNRCHPPGDGDIIVPSSGRSSGRGFAGVSPHVVLGTTSTQVAHPDALDIEPADVRTILAEAACMVDGIAATDVVRTYAGVRPVYRAGLRRTGRRMSRDFAVIDHERRDGIPGFFSIVGGKVTTYRLMAEQTVDAVAQHLGVRNGCASAEVPLDGRH